MGKLCAVFLFMETSDLTIEEFKSNLELIEHRGPDDQQHVRDTLGNDFGFADFQSWIYQTWDVNPLV